MEGQYTAKKVASLSRKQKRAFKDNLQLSFTKWHEKNEAREIIENNIFGVDINEESVEITKLSMFLKIATKNRKLIDLSKNIKCGNSLIDDSTVDAKPFDWNEGFKSIMNKDGFDIIIGNPPYINVESQPKTHKKFYHKRYNTVYKRYDIFGLFFEKSFAELTKKGIISYIVPSQILNNFSYTKLRDLMLNNKYLKEVCYVGDKVFEDAKNDVCIITLDKSRVNNIRLINALNFNEPISIKVKPDYFEKFNNIISFSGHHSVDPIFDKIFNRDLTKISDEFDVFQGIVTGDNSIYIFNIDQLKNLSIEKELFHTVLLGRDFEKWTIRNTNRKILYIDQNTKIEKYPATIEYFKQFKEKLCNSRSASEKSTEWYCLHRPRIKSNLDKVPKILVQGTRNPRLKTRIVATIDEIGVYGLQSINFILPLKDDESIYYLLTILNSKLINYLYQTKYLNVAIKAEYIKNTRIPIPKSKDKLFLCEKSKIMLSMNKELYEKVSKFLDRIHNKYSVEKNSKKLQNFHGLTFSEFKKEVKRVTSLMFQTSLEEKRFDDYWYEDFEETKKEILVLKRKIEKTENELDGMIYQLYGLTRKEIAVVEESLKN